MQFNETNSIEEMPKPIKYLISGIFDQYRLRECHYEDVIANDIVFDYNLWGFIWNRSEESARRVGTRIMMLAIKVNNYDSIKDNLNSLIRQFENDLEVLEFTDEKGYTIEVSRHEKVKKVDDQMDVYSRKKKKGLIIYKIRFAYLEPYEEEEPAEDHTEKFAKFVQQKEKPSWKSGWDSTSQSNATSGDDSPRTQSARELQHINKFDQLQPQHFHPERGDERTAKDADGHIKVLRFNGKKWELK